MLVLRRSMDTTKMIRFNRKASRSLYLVGVACVLTGDAIAQSGANAPVQHLSFDSPEAWALKHFTSASLLSGLQPPETRPIGSVTVGFELGSLPTLDTGQQRVGFNGTAPEDLNKAPIFARFRVRVGLPWKFSAIAAVAPPFRVFGVTSRLFAFGLERPIWERKRWTLGWRGYGQVGSLKGAFTCSHTALAFPPGSPENPAGCVAESADAASLRYAGSEIQFAHRIPKLPRLTPHVAGGVNLIHGIFQVNAPLESKLDRTRLWTRGMTFSGSAGVSYLLTNRATLTIDAFYSPLWVRRNSAAPRTNDGLFNIRVLLNYTLR